jgi:glycosyltransferase involved in cell wall biosynthesis
LGTLDFIAAKQNVVFLGPPGTGKTHLSIGLGIRACQAGYRVAFATAAQWVDRLAAAHHSGRLQDELVKLGRVPLLIIDEVGYIPFESEAANLFFQLISARYERASLIVAANIEMIVAGDIDDELRQQVLRRYPKIRVLGFVEDLGPLTAEARAGLIADTVGGGFKLRLLPHVFHRLPIVGLTTAVDGLPTPAGMGYLAAASLDELATLVCDVIDNLERLNAVQNRAYDDCAGAFSWQQCANSLTAAIGDSTGTSLV